jgi:DNA-binding Xre family transcriptional regulator
VGIIVKMSDHARASAGSTPRKSSAVTAPDVTRVIRSATSREGQPVPSQSDVTQPAETSISRAKSPRLMPRSFRYSANRMAGTFSLTETSAQEKFQFNCMDVRQKGAENFGMAKKAHNPVVETNFKQPFRPTFIRQWRKYRGLTQERLADRVGMSNGNLSMIETGKTGYTQETLETLASALQCAPADLLMRDPTDPEGIWSLWDSAKPAERKQMIEVMKTLLRTSAA